MHILAFRGDDEDGLFHFHDGLVQILAASQETYINDGCLVRAQSWLRLTALVLADDICIGMVQMELGDRVVTD